MFDVGWQELFIIVLVALVVVGPKELPRLLRTITLWARRARQMAREFQDGLEDLAREADIADIKRKLEREAETIVDQGRSIDPTRAIDATAREVEASMPAMPPAPETPDQGKSNPSGSSGTPSA
ncbi:MAG: Sec-independent protein translocase protein TatB [Alphaproteobacteria bacterium]